MSTNNVVDRIIASRLPLAPKQGYTLKNDQPAEGGCGVIGMASNVKVPAKHMLKALEQMRNRGNGKGGGIAAAGLDAEQFGVSQKILENDYLLAIAYLDLSCRDELEDKFIQSSFNVHHSFDQAQIADFSEIPELEVKPPHVVIYFVQPKESVLAYFAKTFSLQNLTSRELADEFVYQNSYRLNTTYYQSTGSKQAFVLSHGKNLLVLKMVGYGDEVIRCYQIEEMKANVWIGHHRYPTKGKVWHPGGAHPFIGLNEALVHNGDFANHSSISEYLAQRNIYPLYLTDTEVAVQVFDLLHRTYRYPLEYVIEAMAPTTERDFSLLPDHKQSVYRMLQTSHMHCSPDGPWFFLIAQSDTQAAHGAEYRLTGITDTSMLRPQVFAWQESETADGEQIAIGFAASEKQSIDAALTSLSTEDDQFWSRADKYWNARGGSHTDGGAFIFTVKAHRPGQESITLTDKFGHLVDVPVSASALLEPTEQSDRDIPDLPSDVLFDWVVEQIPSWNYSDMTAFLAKMNAQVANNANLTGILQVLTSLIDRNYSTGRLRRSKILSMLDETITQIVVSMAAQPTDKFVYHSSAKSLPPKAVEGQILLLNAEGFAIEGEHSLARELQRLYALNYNHFIIIETQGHRFIGNGFSADSATVRIDVYGSPGDYLGSGIDGMTVHVHNNAQDQIAQIMKAGELVIHGDVGQTFMYGAKGGEAYVLGNAAGRPLINAVGKPRVVINGTCLDYLAESFMAGDPLNGGGFVIMNGVTFNENGELIELDTPYPGGNLFSLASGGAIYIRDPHNLVGEDQLNGGEFVSLTKEDWELILPYLHKNESHIGISIDRLLQVASEAKAPAEVYRKIQPKTSRVLHAEEAWVSEMN